MLTYFGRLDSGLKINILMVILTVLSLGLLIYMVDVKVGSMVMDKTNDYVEEAATSASLKIEQTLESSLIVSRGLAGVAESVKLEGLDRKAYLELVKQALVVSPELLGTWVGWEPNALDAKDDAYVSTHGHDASGRFVPYWYRTKTGVDVTPLVDYDKEGNGDYYQVAKKRLKESALEPYMYEVDGENVLITSFSVPLIRNGKFVGVTGVDYSLVKLQKEIDAISPMGSGQVGLISSGGNWVVGFNADSIGKTVKETEPQLEALLTGERTKEPKKMVLKTTGQEVLAVVTPVEIGDTGQHWSVVVIIPTNVVMGPLQKLSFTLIVMGLLAAGAMTVICWVVLQGLLRQPLKQIIHAIAQIGRNNFNVKLDAAKREDDIGTLAKAIEDYRKARMNEVDTQAERERQHEREKETEARRKAELQELGQRFAVVVGGGDGAAHEAGGQPNFSTVASSTNEMFEAINSIAQQMSQVQDTVNRAVSEFQTVESDFNVLSESSTKISEVVGFIGEIASRTNLLSLNASIEAARAGDAGRGFSIVAEEVKNLSGLTTKATDSINEQVQDVLAAIGRSVGSIQNISATVAQINQSNMAVAAAVEEQTNTTKEIASSVQYIKGQAGDLLEHIRKG